MRRLLSCVAALGAAGLIAWSHPAAAQTAPVVAWIQMGPGSTSAALASGKYGDDPTSTTPTVLARAVLSDVTDGCPSMTLDHGADTVAMALRFKGSDVTSTPGGGQFGNSATNGAAGYPQYFVNPANVGTGPFTLPDGTTATSTTWGECEAVVPPGHALATIGGVDLKLPVAHPKRVLVIADTGCRMNGVFDAVHNANQQNCHDPSAFPLAYLASVEASFQPDLVIHVGDYFYRDSNCVGSTGAASTSTSSSEPFSGCNDISSPNYELWGDTFDSWNADLLYPAKPLLQAAPWIMVRGNHESCGRGARGWFALLDPRPFDMSQVDCLKTFNGPKGKSVYPAPTTTTGGALVPTYSGDFTPSYVVAVGNIDVIDHDSSFSNDSSVDPGMSQNYDIDLSNILTTLGPKATAIFATHKPSFGLVSGSVTTTTSNTVSTGGDFTEQAVFNGGTYGASAFTNGVPRTVGLFLSGHIHQLQYLDFTDYTRFAPQLIVGVGGDLLDPAIATGVAPNGFTSQPTFKLLPNPAQQVQVTGGTPANFDLTHAFTQDEFGFAVLDAIADKKGDITGFNADLYKISAARAGLCKLTLTPTRDISCSF